MSLREAYKEKWSQSRRRAFEPAGSLKKKGHKERADLSLTPMVFVHGLKGSQLFDKTHGDLKYLRLRQVTGMTTPDLSLPLSFDPNGRQSFDDLRSGMPLHSIRLAKLVTVEPVYAGLLDWGQRAHRKGHRPFHCFSYDWRRDVSEASLMLELYLENVEAEYIKFFGDEEEEEEEEEKEMEEEKREEAKLLGVNHRRVVEKHHSTATLYEQRGERRENREKRRRKRRRRGRAQVVCHSMGGLVVLDLLSRRPDLFHSVAFVGCPLTAGVSYMQDLHVAAPMGINYNLLNRAVLFTHPSSYSFFPFDYQESKESDSCLCVLVKKKKEGEEGPDEEENFFGDENDPRYQYIASLPREKDTVFEIKLSKQTVSRGWIRRRNEELVKVEQATSLGSLLKEEAIKKKEEKEGVIGGDE
eukprot:CAMPEP_0201513696 /NCGR_PEP_ID=MMETSP0161_2-20130828/5699_1 /ASSEMBLY_ACC=CAM_ASM_000251 /TAXON_ID=180227 /ORGANISM="Neoparamoeba aestuarina, Strain SoJaBio B1-5/56/2" /LENGTH=412 /DNA_ID=CAMNT_0047910007 /DNA_START=22 /DNA_END=1257 /DNA_ORIENTATION=-